MTCISSGHLTGQPGKGVCSTVQLPKGRKSIYGSSLYLYEMHWMHSPGHPDLALNVSWQVILNKTTYNFVEHTNDLHPRELIIWVTLLYDEKSFVTQRAALRRTASTLLILAWV